jgi:lysophospholipid acyltransferase (LPLAT)-like uncharacterized protein
MDSSSSNNGPPAATAPIGLVAKVVSTAQRQAGSGLARYLRFVWRHSEIIHRAGDPGPAPNAPCIFATWHGQHFLAPFPHPGARPMMVPVAHGLFGSVYIHTFEDFDLKVVRGARGKYYHISGGFKAMRALLRALHGGSSVALTVDSQPFAKVVGEGVIALARHSKRPIIPVATAASRGVTLPWRWDRPKIVMPFGRIAMVCGHPILVGEGSAEAARRRLQDALDDLNTLAWNLIVRNGAEACPREPAGRRRAKCCHKPHPKRKSWTRS